VLAPECVRFAAALQSRNLSSFCRASALQGLRFGLRLLIVSFDFGRDLVDGPLEEGVAFRRCQRVHLLRELGRVAISSSPHLKSKT
jgi:hypothetical protein